MDLVFNDKKTVCMCIAKTNSGSSMSSFHLGEKSPDIVNEVKHLGHVIRSDFTDVKDIASQLRGLYCRANMLVKSFSNTSAQIILSVCCSRHIAVVCTVVLSGHQGHSQRGVQGSEHPPPLPKKKIGSTFLVICTKF